MEVFPYILMRIGGGTFENLEPLNIQIINDFENVYRTKQILKDEVSNLLFKNISKLNDSKQQNILLSIKRDLFNERNIKSTDISGINNLIEEDTRNKINEYINSIEVVEKLTKELTEKFENELPEKREILKKLSRDTSIQNGFVFSSQSLYKNIEDYLKHNSEYTKNTKKTEVSIIKYLTRTYAKTSPFSSFNNLGLGIISDETGNDFLQKKDDYKIKSDIRINNSIFAYIRNCIFKLKELYVHFYIIANPTITIQGNQYKYLINFNNVESFQKIGKNIILEYFLSEIREKGRVKYSDFIDKIVNGEFFDATVEEIENYIYKIVELGFFEFDINISGLDAGWINKLIEYLRQIPCESDSKKIIVSTLEYLNEMVPGFEKAGINERLELSNKAYEKFKEMKNHLDGLLKPANEKKDKEENGENDKKSEKNNKRKKNEDEKKEVEDEKKEEKQIIKNVQYYNYDLKPESIFYEDTNIDGIFQINRNNMISILSDIQNLQSYFQQFDFRKDEQDKMVYFFKKKYDDEDTVSMLTFYEEYISLKKKEKEEREKKAKEEKERKEKEEKEKLKNEEETNAKSEKENEINQKNENIDKEKSNEESEIIPDIKKRGELLNKYLESILNIIKKENYSVHDEIKITEEILKEASQYMELEVNRSLTSSHGYFLQFYSDKSKKGEEEIKVVINSSFSGYGKMTSRFLHLFPDNFMNETRNYNSKNSNDYMLAENIDSGIMNFNLHPALMPYEISIPGGNYVLDIENRIPISRIQISYNKEENVLQLIDCKSKKRIFAFDLGFQGYGGRSELFKFLETFSLSKFVSANSLVNKLNIMFMPKDEQGNSNPKKVIIHPRIVYKDHIVLARKEWIIPKVLLPFKNQNEKESEYFSRVQKWRIEVGLPNEVFIKINSQTKVNNKDNKPKKKLSKDDYKPQYMNFNNPFLVRLFEKHLDKVIDSIKVTEMMPESQKMLNLNNNRYVTEFVVQTYNY